MQQRRSLSQQSEVQHELCVAVHDTQHSATACHSRAEAQHKLRMAVHDLQRLIFDLQRGDKWLICKPKCRTSCGLQPLTHSSLLNNAPGSVSYKLLPALLSACDPCSRQHRFSHAKLDASRPATRFRLHCSWEPFHALTIAHPCPLA